MRLTSRRLRCLRKDVSENIHHRSSIPHVWNLQPPPKPEGCLPRESFQGRSGSCYLAHLLPATREDVYNPAPSPSSSSQFFTLPSSSPPSTLIHISPLDYSLFSHCPEFRALFLLSSIIRSSLFASHSVPLITLEHA